MDFKTIIKNLTAVFSSLSRFLAEVHNNQEYKE
jgi:hypothetical protein